jgi:hypothetical protein
VGTYTVLARTQEPPTLATPFGTCSPHAVEVAIRLDPGAPEAVRFDVSKFAWIGSSGADGVVLTVRQDLPYHHFE